MDRLCRESYITVRSLLTNNNDQMQYTAALPTLLDGCDPVILIRSGLNKMNSLVDPASGKITRVTDWPRACIQPFGLALYTLENALGSRDRTGGNVDNMDQSKESFWKAFAEQTTCLSRRWGRSSLQEKPRSLSAIALPTTAASQDCRPSENAHIFVCECSQSSPFIS